MPNEPRLIKPLFNQFLFELNLLGNRSPNTIKWYNTAWNLFLKKYPKIKYLQEIDQDLIEKFLYNGRIERSWAASTLRDYLAGIRGFLSWCVKNQYIENNPASNIRTPKVEQHLPQSLNMEDAKKVITISFEFGKYRFQRFRNRALVSLMILAGLRAQECINLLFNDVDFTDNIIYVNKGKGNKDRIVPIAPKLKTYLEAYIRDRKRLKRKNVSFLLSTNGDHPMTYNGIRGAMKILSAALSLDFSTNNLRHTFATLMIEGGCDIYALSSMMGHSKIQTTLIYLHATPSFFQKEILKHPLS